MAVKNCFADYANFISDLQNRIMKIQLRYDECQSFVSMDYEKGLLTDKDYNKLFNCRMDELITGYDSKYALTSDEVSLIKEYADLDNEGKLLSTFLQAKYLRKNELFQNVFKSVRIFAYYNSLDSFNKRIVFRDNVLKYYLDMKEKCNAEILRLERVYNSTNPSSTKYNQMKEELINIEKAIRYTSSITTLDDNELNKAMEMFYGIKYHYYEWFYKMDLKNEYEEGFIYKEHLDLMIFLQSKKTSVDSIQKELADDRNEAYGISCDLSKFLEGFIEFDYELIEQEFNKKSHFAFLKKNNNKELLYRIFSELIKIYGTNFFLENNFDIENEGKRVSDFELFEQYYSKVYKDIEYVSVDSFVNKFRKLVTAYYKRILKEYNKVLSVKESTLKVEDDALGKGINRGLNHAKLISDIHFGYSGVESITLPGFTNVELEQMYESLKTYILNGFSFDETDVLKKKV